MECIACTENQRKPWKTCNVSWTLFIVQTHHDNGYRCNFACFMSFIRLFITIFSLIQTVERSSQATRLPATMHALRSDGSILIIYTLHTEINDEKLLNISVHSHALSLMETKSLTLLQCAQCSAVYAVVGKFSMQIGSLTALMIKHNANYIGIECTTFTATMNGTCS